jgi:acetyl esterase/lipase
MKALRVAGNFFALLLACMLAALEIWTIVPAPTIATLVAAVAVPELAPWFALVTIAIGTLVQVMARGWARIAATSLCALALGCALVPLILLPATLAAADRELTQTLGVDYQDAAPDAQRAGMQRAPFSLRAAFFGLPAPHGIRIDRDVPYAASDGAKLALDLYRPARAGVHPAVVLVYGGAWHFGERRDLADLAGRLAGSGFTAVVVDYRKAPAYRFPTQLDDVRAGIRAVAAHARAWGVDTTHVAVCGFSAGAELALLAAYGTEPVHVAAAVGVYAPSDLVGGYTYPPVPDPVDVRRILLMYLAGPPLTRMPSYVEGSPIRHVRPNLPPTLLVGGARDELVRIAFQHQMRDALRVHGDTVASLELPWSNHAFDTIPNSIGGQFVRYYLERFFAATL